MCLRKLAQDVTDAPVTTQQAEDKYTTACKTAYPNESNVTAVRSAVGPIQACEYVCAKVTQAFNGQFVDLEVLKTLGQPISVDDGSSCAPERECLSGHCHDSDEIKKCSGVNSGLKDITHSIKDTCNVECNGKDGSSSTKVSAHEGTPCLTTREILKIKIPTIGSCKEGKCTTSN